MNVQGLESIDKGPREDSDEEDRILKVDDIGHEIEGVELQGTAFISFKDIDKTYYSNQFKEKFQKPRKVPFMNLEDQWTRMKPEGYDPCEVKLSVLDVEKDVLDDFTVVVIGRRRSGKSFFARWFMYHLRHRFPCGIVITGTKLNRFWTKYVPDKFVYDIEEINEVLPRVYRRQELIKNNPQLGIDPRFFIILDDVMSDKYRVRFSVMLSKAFTDGRHYGVFTLITCQDPFGIGPDLRENADLVVTFRQNQESRKEAISLNYLDAITDKHKRLEFLWNTTRKIDPNTGQALDWKITTDEEQENAIPRALVINQAKNTEDFTQVFKTVIANEPEDFILGSEDFWKAGVQGDYKKVMNTKK